MEVRYQVEDTVSRALARKSETIATQGLKDAALAGAQVVANRAVERLSIQSWESGDTGRSVHAEPGEADRHHATATAGTDKEHAVYIEYGTGIYGTGPGATGQPIRPKTGKVLHWVDAEGEHFAREVRGMYPRPFLRPALDETHDQVLEAMARTLRNALEAAG